MRGRFRPNPKALDLEGAVFDWAHSLVCLRLSHPGGLLAAPSARWSEAQLVFSPGINRDGWGEALQAPADASSVEPDGIVFSIEADLKGSTRLAVVPSAGQNKLTLRSTWPDPSYGGSALPTHHETGPSGFVATWEQSYFGHGYPQQWTEAAAQSRAAFAAMDDSAVDVTLLQPVDSYRLVERAIKYGLLFLVLVFGIFFLFEVTAGLRIHPLQYLMVGAALVLFFLGYLALGEFIDGGLAYGVAATASTALVAGYSAAVLKTGLRSLLVGGGLAATYAYLYFILQLQDYSLLAGTAALFLLLGVAMWATRRIDWYGGK
jgi:inner membrane protein